MNISKSISKNKHILYLLFVLIVFPLEFCKAANLSGTYYIDASNGLDSNTGQSELQAWKSFDNVNKSVLTAGTKIFLKKGSVWNQRLVICGTGTISNWISVGAYGDGLDKPKISLTNNKNDIALLITDLDKTSGTVKAQNISFIEIKDLEIANTRMGIYFRSVKATVNTGFRVKNVTFNNINCDEVMQACNAGTDMTIKNAEITNQLSASKGNLLDQNGNAGGGKYEYIFPAAIFVGGKTLTGQRVSGSHTTVLTEFEVFDCQFNECIAGVMSVFYWPFTSGMGADAWRQIVNKVKVLNCSGTGIVNGLIALDGVNGGAVSGLNGIMKPDENGWGILQNVSVKMGSAVAGRTWPNGTTGLIFSNVQNFLVDSCEFSDLLNQGNPDGCGFDFETNNTQVTVQNTKFFNNDGHAMLLMNGGGFGGNTNIIIQRNLFAKNIKSSNSEFELLFSQDNDGHQNVKVNNNIAFLRKTNKDGKSISFTNTNRFYITASDNDIYYLDDAAQPITVSFLGKTYTYNSMVSVVNIPVVTNITFNNNELFTKEQQVIVKTEIAKGAPVQYKISENSDFSGAEWLFYNSIFQYNLSPGNGLKTTYLKVRNIAGESYVFKANITFKTSPDKLDASNRTHPVFIHVMPNPVSAMAKVSFTKMVSDIDPTQIPAESDDYQLKVFNLNGEVLETSYHAGSDFMLNVNRFPKGTLLLQVQSLKNSFTKTIIKK